MSCHEIAFVCVMTVGIAAPAQQAMGSQNLAGDYDQSRSVDAADFVVWRENVGGPTLPNRGVGITGTVHLIDYAFWKSQFGVTSRSITPFASGGGVPEPNSCALALFAMLAITALRPRRRRSGDETDKS